MPQAKANKISVDYEIFGEPTSPPILLIVGLSAQLIYWDEEFCRQVAQSGLYVIRFDNRDAGLSTKFDEAGLPDMSDIILNLMSGQKVTPPYTIEVMAADAVGLLDALKIEKAHICGMSMGGMIAQSLAIHYPQRVLSLTSIYSTTGNPHLPQPKPEIMRLLLTPAPQERELFIRFQLALFRALTVPRFGFDEKWMRDTMAKAYDSACYPQGTGRQLAAIFHVPQHVVTTLRQLASIRLTPGFSRGGLMIRRAPVGCKPWLGSVPESLDPEARSAVQHQPKDIREREFTPELVPEPRVQGVEDEREEIPVRPEHHL